MFERFRENVLDGAVGLTEDLCADDVIVDLPFAPPGGPRRFVGREEFAAFAAAGRSALPVRFDEFRNITVHHTADPEVIVTEYEVSDRKGDHDRPQCERRIRSGSPSPGRPRRALARIPGRHGHSAGVVRSTLTFLPHRRTLPVHVDLAPGVVSDALVR
ncbi:hypothetical protein SNL152K_56 [Streptomyces sp. NL15-2K]|nr:hypothetical protein SNL152K_56 [Streptomyces sp. NL15-2K]